MDTLPRSALASNIEVTAATVQRGDVIQLGGRPYRVQDLFQLHQGAKQLLFESGELLSPSPTPQDRVRRRMGDAGPVDGR
ncbi:hypothetical protein [Streptomyces achromogenes]|uniref:hypothetical protein n=1 Tax=Streptomyces achromogenes TaxID=67255 RepID=UPI003A80B503